MIFTGVKLNSTGHTGRVMDNRPVSFPDWKQALAKAGLSSAGEVAYTREVITFLKHCKTQHAPATVLLAKQYVEKQERLRTGPVREALRWFFRAAKTTGSQTTEHRRLRLEPEEHRPEDRRVHAGRPAEVTPRLDQDRTIRLQTFLTTDCTKGHG
ncbi:MAG: hypothetical protein HYV95_06830 [Opitutae bacterium]|nr:hypothetical protein [Opitutae bacterium]